jgi:hypothetical protein
MAIVRARDAGPEHRAKIESPTYAKTSRPVPKTLLIEIGTPIKSFSARFKCGTDLLWPVVRIIEPSGIELLSPAHVCRHEIEAGD